MANDSQNGSSAPQARVLASNLAHVLDEAPMSVAAFGPDLRILDFNTAFARFAERYGSAAAGSVRIGMPLQDVIPPDNLAEMGSLVGPAFRGRTVTSRELEIRGPLGSSFWDIVFAPIFEDDAVVGVLQISVDATDRVEAKRTLELRVAERTLELERQRQVAEGLHDILRILNSCCPGEQVRDFIIAEASRLLGSDAVAVYSIDIDGGYLTMQTAYGLADDRVRDLIIPVMSSAGVVAATIARRRPMVVPDATMLLDSARRVMPAEQIELIESVVERYRSILAVPVVVGDELYGALTLYYPEPREFSDKDIALAADLADHLALALENAALRDLVEVSAASAERSRLARDLHDAVTQTLFSASLIAEVLPVIWERDPDEGRRRLEELRRLSRGALAEMRTLLVELRPLAIVEAEFGELMHQLAEVASATGLDVTVDCDESATPLPSDVQVAMYRIAQEALNNVMRHANANRVTITVRRGEGEAVMTIADDGSGFELEAKRGTEHIGLMAMSERTDDIGATLTVSSAPGAGTTVKVQWRAGGECSC